MKRKTGRYTSQKQNEGDLTRIMALVSKRYGLESLNLFFYNFAMTILFSYFGLSRLFIDCIKYKFTIDKYHLSYFYKFIDVRIFVSITLTLHTISSIHTIFYLYINKYLKQNSEDYIMLITA